MKLNKKAKSKKENLKKKEIIKSMLTATENIEYWFSVANEAVDEVMSDLRHYTMMADINLWLQTKCDLLKERSDLPIDSDQCPFCIHNGYVDGSPSACIECKYGEINGICISDNSVYDNIHKNYIIFKQEIKNYYNSRINSFSTSEKNALNENKKIIKDALMQATKSIKNELKSLLSNEKVLMKDLKKYAKYGDIRSWLVTKEQLMCSRINIPLSIESCPFCLFHNFDGSEWTKKNCRKCMYGKIQKSCCSKKSVYTKIVKSQSKLEDCLNMYSGDMFSTFDSLEK